MTQDENQKISDQLDKIKIIYLIITVFFVINCFFVYINQEYIVPVGFALARGYSGLEMFIYGGYVSIILMFVSIAALYASELKRAFITSLIANIFIAVNIISILIFYMLLSLDSNSNYVIVDSGFYCLVGILIASIIVNILIYSNKKNATFEGKAPSKPLSQDTKNQTFCPNCGASLVDTTGGFCSKCGSPLK
jgi:hypothetical protein